MNTKTPIPTSRPWTYEKVRGGRGRIMAHNGNSLIADDVSETNGKLIVRAVNAHEELLEMLYQCRAYIPVVDRPKGLDEAIAKAEKGA